MSNGVKIALVVLVALGILVFVFMKKDKKKGSTTPDSDDSSTTTKPTCTTISGAEYLGKKTVARDEIMAEIGKGEYTKTPAELFYEYRAEAIGAGKPDLYSEVLQYSYWAEADKQVQKDGFCFVNV